MKTKDFEITRNIGVWQESPLAFMNFIHILVDPPPPTLFSGMFCEHPHHKYRLIPFNCRQLDENLYILLTAKWQIWIIVTKENKDIRLNKLRKQRKDLNNLRLIDLWKKNNTFSILFKIFKEFTFNTFMIIKYIDKCYIHTKLSLVF